jgi:hypothetical protein
VITTTEVRSIAQREARRLEQESAALARVHQAAASRWSHVHFTFGIPSTVLAGATSVAAFAEAPIGILHYTSDQLAGVLALLVGLFTALSTFLDSNQRAGAHQAAWARYETIRHKAHLLAELDLLDDPSLDPGTKDATERIYQLSAEINEANATCPQVGPPADVKEVP